MDRDALVAVSPPAHITHPPEPGACAGGTVPCTAGRAALAQSKAWIPPLLHQIAARQRGPGRRKNDEDDERDQPSGQSAVLVDSDPPTERPTTHMPLPRLTWSSTCVQGSECHPPCPAWRVYFGPEGLVAGQSGAAPLGTGSTFRPSDAQTQTHRRTRKRTSTTQARRTSASRPLSHTNSSTSSRPKTRADPRGGPRPSLQNPC